MPIQKASGFVTNSWFIAEEIRQFRCRNRDKQAYHEHASLIGGDNAKLAEVYPPALVDAILAGLVKQIEYDLQIGKGDWCLGAMEIGIHVDEDAVDFDAPLEEHMETAFDDMTGAALDSEKVQD